MKKPNVPGEIQPGSQYSFAIDSRVNGWLFTALAISAATDLFHWPDARAWPDFPRALVAIAPFVALLMWVRQLSRWIRGMDELHRAVTIAACLFATVATFFSVAVWHHLVRWGVFGALFPGQLKAFANADPCVPWLSLWFLMSFYFVGQAIFSRRYR